MDWLTSLFPNLASGDMTPFLGQSLDPMQSMTGGAPIDAGVTTGPMQAGAAGAAPGPLGAALGPGVRQPGGLADILRGVAAPKPPDVVKPSTPAQPQLKGIEAGELLKFIQMLSQPPAGAAAAQRPLSLSQALPYRG